MSVEKIQFDVSPPGSPPQPATALVKAPAAKPPLDAAERHRQAEIILYNNTFWSLGAGALVVPGVDLLAASAVQLKQLKQLADLYEVKFSDGLAKKLVASLITSLGGVGLGALAGSAIKLIPGVGSTLGLFSQPVTVAACNRALGRVFILHFEAGGTLLDFEPRKMKDYFRGEFEKARHQVEHLKEKAVEAKEQVAETVKEKAAEAKDKAVELKEKAADKASELKEKAADKASEFKEKAQPA